MAVALLRLAVVIYSRQNADAAGLPSAGAAWPSRSAHLVIVPLQARRGRGHSGSGQFVPEQQHPAWLLHRKAITPCAGFVW